MLFLFYLLGTGSENLHVSHILQKAKIEVSEDGTKASAATSKYALGQQVSKAWAGLVLVKRASVPWSTHQLMCPEPYF